MDQETSFQLRPLRRASICQRAVGEYLPASGGFITRLPSDSLCEPPIADPHEGWSGGWGAKTSGYPINGELFFLDLLSQRRPRSLEFWFVASCQLFRWLEKKSFHKDIGLLDRTDHSVELALPSEDCQRVKPFYRCYTLWGPQAKDTNPEWYGDPQSICFHGRCTQIDIYRKPKLNFYTYGSPVFVSSLVSYEYFQG